MPQIKAAKKALKSSARKRVINDRWRRRLRESIYTVKSALQSNDTKQAQKSYLKAQSVIDRAAKHNIIHRNKASHLKQKLSQAVNQAK